METVFNRNKSGSLDRMRPFHVTPAWGTSSSCCLNGRTLHKLVQIQPSGLKKTFKEHTMTHPVTCCTASKCQFSYTVSILFLLPPLTPSLTWGKFRVSLRLNLGLRSSTCQHKTADYWKHNSTIISSGCYALKYNYLVANGILGGHASLCSLPT